MAPSTMIRRGARIGIGWRRFMRLMVRCASVLFLEAFCAICRCHATERREEVTGEKRFRCDRANAGRSYEYRGIRRMARKRPVATIRAQFTCCIECSQVSAVVCSSGDAQQARVNGSVERDSQPGLAWRRPRCPRFKRASDTQLRGGVIPAMVRTARRSASTRCPPIRQRSR